MIHAIALQINDPLEPVWHGRHVDCLAGCNGVEITSNETRHILVRTDMTNNIVSFPPTPNFKHNPQIRHRMHPNHACRFVRLILNFSINKVSPNRKYWMMTLEGSNREFAEKCYFSRFVSSAHEI